MPKTSSPASIKLSWARLRRALDRYLNHPRHRLLIARAFRTARRAHWGQRRASGDEYLIHPLEVARILAEMGLDPVTVAAALLHDVLEDSSLDRETLERNFGREVANLVEGVSKLSILRMPQADPSDHPALGAKHQAENLKKLFLAMSRDIRVIFIRLADRLHNMRTIQFLEPQKRRFIAQETLDIYASLASRLGLWEFKWELEDLAFAVLEPGLYRQLFKGLSQRLRNRRQTLSLVKRTISSALSQEGIAPIAVDGRTKHIYSIHQKMQRKGCSLEEILDLQAVRVIVPTESDCYRAFGVIQNLWLPVPGRFKDHIALPKPNGYRSLHTTVLGPDGSPLEIQIRTPEMHLVNEYGVAAHWAYKEGRDLSGQPPDHEIYTWVRRLLEWFEEGQLDPDYLQHLKTDILGHQVFVFTPKGQVVDLPAGSTPLDFAYRIHTQVGHRFIGAKVNSRIVPLDYRLKNADIVDILTSNRDNPSRDWLNIVRTRHARSKIRQWFKREQRPENIAQGRELLQAELERKHIGLGLRQEELLAPLLKSSHYGSLDDLYVAIGLGECNPGQLVKKIGRLLPRELRTNKKSYYLPPRTGLTEPPPPVAVPGLSALNIRLGRCCRPEPGQEIWGYVSQGRVTVHRHDCPNFCRLSQNRDRVVRIRWIDNS